MCMNSYVCPVSVHVYECEWASVSQSVTPGSVGPRPRRSQAELRTHPVREVWLRLPPEDWPSPQVSLMTL